MAVYILKRILILVPTLLGVLTLTFVVTQFVPGGPVDWALYQIDRQSGAKAGAAGGAEATSFNYTGRKGIDKTQVEQLRLALDGKLGALLRGLLFCVPCGTAMMHTYTMRKSKRYRYYVCYNAQQQG